MQKNEKLEENKVLFKAIKEEKTCIKAKYKAFANFAKTKSNTKFQEETAKKNFIKWLKCKKYGCKHLVKQAYKYANKKYDKCHKKKHIFCFYDSYTFFNKENTSKGPIISSSDFKKNVNYVTQVVAKKMFETSITRKIIVDLSTT